MSRSRGCYITVSLLFVLINQEQNISKLPTLTEDAATTMVHAFVTSRVDYCISVLHHVSAASVEPLQNMLIAAARIILRKAAAPLADKSALNLLHVLAHTSWGADQETLLHLYRSLIRSKLDYGCVVYGSAVCTTFIPLHASSHSEPCTPFMLWCLPNIPII